MKKALVLLLLVGSSLVLWAAPTIEQALDKNSNSLIDDTEILQALNLWIQQMPVPGAEMVITDFKMIELLQLWIRQTPIPTGDGPEPAIEDATPTPDFLDEIISVALKLEGVGGPSSELIRATHNLQVLFELLFGKLDVSEDNEEIPFLMDLLHAVLLDYLDALETLGTDGAVVLETVQRGLEELASAKQKVDAALIEFVVALGEPREGIRDVAVVIPPELFIRVVKEIWEGGYQLPSDRDAPLSLPSLSSRLQELLLRIPPEARLTVISSHGSIIVDPSGRPYPQPTPKWWERAWDKVKGWGARALARAALVAKLGHLLVKYGWAITDCYYHHFPNWAAIDDCLVEKHGLARDVITRIITALMDP